MTILLNKAYQMMSMFNLVKQDGLSQKEQIWTLASICVTSKMKSRQAFADLYCSQELTQDLDNQIICFRLSTQ